MLAFRLLRDILERKYCGQGGETDNDYVDMTFFCSTYGLSDNK